MKDDPEVVWYMVPFEDGQDTAISDGIGEAEREVELVER